MGIQTRLKSNDYSLFISFMISANILTDLKRSCILYIAETAMSSSTLVSRRKLRYSLFDIRYSILLFYHDLLIAEYFPFRTNRNHIRPYRQGSSLK